MFRRVLALPLQSLKTQKTIRDLLRVPYLYSPTQCSNAYSTDDDFEAVDSLLKTLNLPTDEVEIEEEIEKREEIGTSLVPGHRIRGILVPTLETHSAEVAGQKYEHLPIAHIFASYNNTIIRITNYNGEKSYAGFSTGAIGFRNAKKKTAIAAQATGLAAGQLAVEKGLTHVRVAIKGLGKGRLSACKGLETAGLQIVSLTDTSMVNWGERMPRKKRRL